MRIPVAVTLESRDGTVSKDAKVVNGVLEPRGDQAVLRKRPGVADLGQVWKVGTAQLLYPWNGLWAIYGDVLNYGTVATIVSPTFATWNSADKGSSVTLSNGNLTAAFALSANVLVRANTSKSVGKFYWEVTVTQNLPIIGIAKSGAALTNFLGHDANGWGYVATNGNMVTNNVSSAYGTAFTAGDIVGVALDCDNGTLTFYKNGVSQGQAFTGLSGTFFPAASGSTGEADQITVNFGASAFSFAPPTGYTAGIAALGTSLGPTTGGLRFDAQEVGASAATQLMMVKNRTQAWTIDRSGTKTLISFPSSMGAATYSVATLTRSGTTATATLSVDPGVNIGDSITVAGASPSDYNITANVTAVTPYVSTPSRTVTISSLTRSGTTATAVTATAHGLTSGSSYAISGATEPAYNGTYAVTVVDATTFTYTVTVTVYSVYGAGVTLNPSDKAANVTLSGGNLTATVSGAGPIIGSVRATTGISSGVKVWEVTVTGTPVGWFAAVGIADATFNVTTGWVGVSGHSNGWTNSANTVIGFRLDMTNGLMATFLNGVRFRTEGISAGTVYPAITLDVQNLSTGTVTAVANFGATAFTYNYDSPTSPDSSSSRLVTIPASVTNATVSYPVAGSPTSPAIGTITLTTNGGMVPGLPYIDGYFFVMDQNGVMWQSSLDAPGTWPALSNLTAQNENGRGKALNRSLNYLIAFKEWSTEFFYDLKVPNFSFQPADNGFTEVGCASGESVTHVDGSLIWVSQVKDRGRSVHLMTGLQQQKVSTPDVERILNADDLATVHAYGIKLGGHSLYLLTLVTSNITLLYDMDTQSWLTWSSLTARNAVSVSSITLSGTTATVVTSTAHGMSDGDPVTIAGAAQSAYNGTFQTSYVSATSFTFQTDSTAVTPATGTITAIAYTSSYFKFTKYCDYQGLSLFLHESNGHLYQMLPTLYQDASIPIDLMFRTARLDGGDSSVKILSRLIVVGDVISDTMMIRYSDDDCNTFTAYEIVDLSQETADLRQGGPFRRRNIEGRHIGNTPPRIEALELDVTK